MKQTFLSARQLGRRLGCSALLVALFTLAGCQQAGEQTNEGDKKKTDTVERIVAIVPEDPMDKTPKGPDTEWKPNEDLPLIPRNALGIAAVRVGELWRSPLVQNLKTRLPGHLFDPIQEHEQKVGLRVEDIDRVTAVVLGLPTTDPKPPMAVIVATRRAMDRQKLVAEYGVAGAAERKIGELSFFPLKDGLGIHFVNNYVAVIGDPANLPRIAQNKPAPGPLEADVNEIEKHTIVVALDATPALQAFGNEIPPVLGVARQVKLASLYVDVSDSLTGNLRLGFPKDDVAKVAADALQKAVPVGQQAVAKMPLPINDLEKQKNVRARFDNAFKGIKVGQQGSAVNIGFQLTGDDFAVIPDVFAGAINRAQDAAGRAQVISNMKLLGLAIHEYQLAHNALPAAGIHSKDGKALLSWRVALLPYIGQEALYKEFKLDEAWDGPNNKKLIDKMPKIYGLPGQTAPGQTHLRAFSGPATAFAAPKGVNFPDIKDGAANTVAVVEAGEAVPWTKPLDMPYEMGRPLPLLGKMEPGAFLALFVDGSVRSVPLDEARIRAYISREGKEVIAD